MNNSQPKIVYNDDFIDLRSHFDKDRIILPQKNLHENPFQREWTSRPKTKHERNEVVNTALKKLAKTYNISNTPFEKKIRDRIRENSFCDPYRKDSRQRLNSLRSKSEITTLPEDESKNSKAFCPSSPIIHSIYEKGGYKKKTEPYKNKFTMTKMTLGNKEETHKDGKNLKRDKSIDKLIQKLTMADQISISGKNENNHVWKDQRLSEKYSLLKLPWKRSHTLPVFSQPSILIKEAYKKKLIDNSDKKTYLYDDGSEVDSAYLELKRPQYFGFTFQDQLLMLLNISAYVCALLVISLIVWLISENKLFLKWFVPKPPEEPIKKYFKYVCGSIVYTITSIIRFIGSIFAIPTQQVYHPATEYSWPPVH